MLIPVIVSIRISFFLVAKSQYCTSPKGVPFSGLEDKDSVNCPQADTGIAQNKILRIMLYGAMWPFTLLVWKV